MTETITVQELGEDGDLWMVTGTTDAHSADEAIRQHVERVTGQTIEALTDADDLVEFKFILRNDWALKPGPNSADPMEDATLLYGLTAFLHNFPAFTGFLVSA